MFLAFFYTLRALKVPVGVHEWLDLMEALSQDLAASSLDRFYPLGRALLVKSEALYDAYDQAFLACFGGGNAELQFKKELSDWLNRIVDPALRPELPEGLEKLDLEELRRRFQERLRQQSSAHHGGNHWIGTGGTSPFGHSGAHPSGIRIGGPGGGRMAAKVAEERRFRNYRHDRVLDTRQLKVALKRLRRLEETGPAAELDLDDTIAQTCRNAGEIELVFSPPRKNQAELLLLMDVGGSMDSYAHLAEALFSAAHASKHFKAFRHYYFHNCIYSRIYTDMRQRDFIPTEELFRRYRKSFHLIIVGDACMNPYELFVPNGSIDYWEQHAESGLAWLNRIHEHFPSAVWLNPEPEAYWEGHPTIHAIGETIPMYPLSVTGLTQAVDHLRRREFQV
ncbi:MAG TPA: VWA containing CoxE family protein [Deltaproteobacteria bacterium]|nr:VWA containing CoxE family protein [Deltaproteobacteria bacterium]